MIKIKDRKRQRLNRRLKHKEELLDKKNDLGVKDLTAYNAVKQMVTNGKASIVYGDRPPGNWRYFITQKKGATSYGENNYECTGIICTDGNQPAKGI